MQCDALKKCLELKLQKWFSRKKIFKVKKMKPPVELEVRQQTSDYIQPSTEVNIQNNI